MAVEALNMPAGDAKSAACVAAKDALRRELWGSGKRSSERNLLRRVLSVTAAYEAARISLAAAKWQRIAAKLKTGVGDLGPFLSLFTTDKTRVWLEFSPTAWLFVFSPACWRAARRL